MDKLQKLKKIATKAQNLKGDLFLAKEFVEMDEKMVDMKEQTDVIATGVGNKLDEIIAKQNNDLLTEDAVVFNLPEAPKVEFPTEISISNLPDTQKVEVTNFPEVKAPIVNVKAPEVNIEAPIINIDTDSIEKELKTSNETLKEISGKLDKEESESVGKVTLVDKDGKPFKFPESRVYGGGGVSKYITNVAGETINPATEETLQGIAGSSWISSNIDTVDATYYYFLSFIAGTTKWRINRLNKTSYVSDYATGDSSIATAWTNRTTQTYATIY